MAKRLLFRPTMKHKGFVSETEIQFDWRSPYTYGKEATQRNIACLHSEICDLCQTDYEDILEVSGASTLDIGRQLSAPNLTALRKRADQMHGSKKRSVEALYQGSKVFEKGGPHHELYNYTGLAAKKKLREKTLGGIIGFNYEGVEFACDPKDAFYNWLYCSILCDEKNRELSETIINDYEFFGYTDIFFNHETQKACQARALAIFLGMANADYSINQITNFSTHVEIRKMKQWSH